MKVGVTANEHGSSTKSILTLTHTSTHARACLHTIAQSRTHVCANACMHAHIPSYIQTDRRHVLIHTYIHTYIYNVHFRQTDKHMVDESCRQTDGIHTYISTYVRTYIHALCVTTCLSVRPIVCLLVHVCCLSA